MSHATAPNKTESNGDAAAKSFAPGVVRKATQQACRFCGSTLEHVFVDLGMSPLCESYLAKDQLDSMEPFYPLKAFVCKDCLLVQLPEYVSGEEIFSEYAYFSSYSTSWLAHAERYTKAMIERLGLNTDSQVVEVASNDGYLLQYFKAAGIPVLGIEPAANVARAAEEKGVPTRVEYLGRETARRLADEGVQADLLAANNVVAHVPDLNSFIAGLAILLKPTGVLTMEFPHLVRLIDGNQFDTIYHEHFCYHSLLGMRRILAEHGLHLFDAEELTTHGGSLRVYARHANHERDFTHRAKAILAAELESGYGTLDTYLHFSGKVTETKRRLLEFLVAAKKEGKRIVGYGAPGKGNTLLNYCGIRTDFLDYTVDRNPHKHGKFTPGTHIPIHSPEKLAETKPDYILILPWNLKDEIVAQLGYAREWGAKFVVPIPELAVIDEFARESKELFADMPTPYDTAAHASPAAAWDGARVLVTGAAGFLGAHLCRALVEQGATVFGLSRRDDNVPGVRMFAGDNADFEFVRGVLADARPEFVFHLAGSADGSRDLDRVMPGLRDDLVSTVALLTAATERGVGRIVVTGSMEEPDLATGDERPSSPYAAAKLCVGFYARMFQAVYKTPVTLVRPFVTYGPGQSETKLIPYVIRSLARGQAPQLSSCERTADLVYVDDMIGGVMKAALAPVSSEAIDLGSGRLVSLRHVVERIAALMKAGVEPAFGALENRKQEQVRAACVELAAERLGWQVTTSLDDGLRPTIAWYLQQTKLEPAGAYAG